MKKNSLFFTLFMLLSFILAGQAYAAKKEIEGYVVDINGKLEHTLWGECIHTGRWKPSMAIPECEGGISDQDKDGVADKEDKCPDTPTGVKVDGKGCPLDTDGDGVADYLDKCPGTPAGVKVDAKGCPLDSDGDGIVDYKDKCPGTAPGVKVDNNGCALKAKIELKGVTFTTGSAKLTAGSSTTLDQMASILKRYPDQKVMVAGHTDSTGPRAFNVRLSQKRAESVRKYLIDHGVAAANLSAKGYGPDKPVASNATREGRAKNRRVELILEK